MAWRELVLNPGLGKGQEGAKSGGTLGGGVLRCLKSDSGS